MTQRQPGFSTPIFLWYLLHDAQLGRLWELKSMLLDTSGGFVHVLWCHLAVITETQIRCDFVHEILQEFAIIRQRN